MGNAAKIELTFEGLIPDTAIQANAAYYDGYDGFDFTDFELLTKHGIRHFDWLDTGFSSVLHGDCEAFTGGDDPGPNTYAWLTPAKADANKTFDLVSGIFASGYRVGQPLVVRFWAFNANGSYHGELTARLSQTPEKINFKFHNFQDIASVYISSYSPYGVIGFFPVAMDNIRVHWNAPGPRTNVRPVSPALFHGVHPHVAHALLLAADGNGGVQSGAAAAQPHHAHGELLALDGVFRHPDSHAGLTGQFSLPHIDWHGG